MEELPEGSQEGLPDPNQFRIRPAEYEPTPDAQPTSLRVTFEGLPAPAADAELAEPRPSGRPNYHAAVRSQGSLDAGTWWVPRVLLLVAAHMRCVIARM